MYAYRTCDYCHFVHLARLAFLFIDILSYIRFIWKLYWCCLFNLKSCYYYIEQLIYVSCIMFMCNMNIVRKFINSCFLNIFLFQTYEKECHYFHCWNDDTILRNNKQIFYNVDGPRVHTYSFCTIYIPHYTHNI